MASEPASDKVHKHHHRERQAETTFCAKYTVEADNLELVGADAPKTWSFRLAAGNQSCLVRQLRKVDPSKPGVKYRLKLAAEFKFVAPQ